MVSKQTRLLFPDLLFYVPKEQVLFASLSGSHSYGWETINSDFDIRIVYLPDFNSLINPFFQDKINHYMNNPPYDVTTIPFGHFLSLLYNGNGNYLENLFMHKFYKTFFSKGLITSLKTLVKNNLNYTFLKHYLGYYSSLKNDLKNQTRLQKYGYEKLVLNAYRVLLTGIILHDKKKIVYNLKELDKYYSGTNCLNVLETYLLGRDVNGENRIIVSSELNFLEELLESYVYDGVLSVDRKEFRESLSVFYYNLVKYKMDLDNQNIF